MWWTESHSFRRQVLTEDLSRYGMLSLTSRILMLHSQSADMPSAPPSRSEPLTAREYWLYCYKHTWQTISQLTSSLFWLMQSSFKMLAHDLYKSMVVIGYHQSLKMHISHMTQYEGYHIESPKCFFSLMEKKQHSLKVSFLVFLLRIWKRL